VVEVENLVHQVRMREYGLVKRVIARIPTPGAQRRQQQVEIIEQLYNGERARTRRKDIRCQSNEGDIEPIIAL
jgi:hypothetical protein